MQTTQFFCHPKIDQGKVYLLKRKDIKYSWLKQVKWGVYTSSSLSLLFSTFTRINDIIHVKVLRKHHIIQRFQYANE